MGGGQALNMSLGASNYKICCCGSGEIHVPSTRIRGPVTHGRCTKKCQYQCSVKRHERFIIFRKHFDQVQEWNSDVMFHIRAYVEDCECDG
jgi:hypothetical protein